MSMRIGDTLRTVRIAKGISVRRFAYDIGIPFPTLARIEKGESPGGETMMKIMNYLFTADSKC
jgi:transcriptional regulator with XRE-family HTH domain